MPAFVAKPFTDLTPAVPLESGDEMFFSQPRIGGPNIYNRVPVSHLDSRYSGNGMPVLVTAANSPYQSLPFQTVYVDNRATDNLVVMAPINPVEGMPPVTIYPLGDSSIHPFTVDCGTSNVDGGIDPLVNINTANVVFQLRYVNINYGWGFFSAGSSYAIQNVTVNGGGLVNIRHILSGDVQLVADDLVSGVATETNISGGTIFLPDAALLTEGWQTTITQLGTGTYTFALHANATGEEIISVGQQLHTLGRGTLVTVLLLSNKRWLIDGDLSSI